MLIPVLIPCKFSGRKHPRHILRWPGKSGHPYLLIRRVIRSTKIFLITICISCSLPSFLSLKFLKISRRSLLSLMMSGWVGRVIARICQSIGCRIERKRLLTLLLVVGHVSVSPFNRSLLLGSKVWNLLSENRIHRIRLHICELHRSHCCTLSVLRPQVSSHALHSKVSEAHFRRLRVLIYRHNPFILYDSIALNATRRNRTRNFNNFAQDLQADALPQYVFITPNVSPLPRTILLRFFRWEADVFWVQIVNDAHDTDINFASEWLGQSPTSSVWTA